MVAIDRLAAYEARQDNTPHGSGNATPGRSPGHTATGSRQPIPLRPGPAQKPVELILTRQLAGYVDVATLLFDAALTLVFYNDAAAALLGRAFESTGPLPPSERQITLGLGSPAGDPVALAVTDNVPTHGHMTLRTFDAQAVEVACTVVPMRGQTGESVGAVAYLWAVGTQ